MSRNRAHRGWLLVEAKGPGQIEVCVKPRIHTMLLSPAGNKGSSFAVVTETKMTH